MTSLGCSVIGGCKSPEEVDSMCEMQQAKRHEAPRAPTHERARTYSCTHTHTDIQTRTCTCAQTQPHTQHPPSPLAHTLSPHTHTHTHSHTGTRSRSIYKRSCADAPLSTAHSNEEAANTSCSARQSATRYCRARTRASSDPSARAADCCMLVLEKSTDTILAGSQESRAMSSDNSELPHPTTRMSEALPAWSERAPTCMTPP